MKRTAALLASTLLLAVGLVPANAQQIPPPQPNTCGLAEPTFCDGFDVKGGGNVRNGDLAEWWGVSRMLGGGSNPGQGQYNAWADTDIVTCTGVQRVAPPQDVQICNGQLREASNDAGDVSVLAMYPKLPFDFAGRTGRITFDVTNDTLGMHTSWPELWVTDQPVPAPFTHLGSWKATPRNGFGLRFGAMTTPGQGPNLTSSCPSDGQSRWSVDSVVVARNYVIDDSTDAGSTTAVQRTGCVTTSSGPNGPFNHIEVQVSENQLDVFATDAGSTQLVHIATVPNARLNFTRGLLWIQDAHYNATKFGGTAMHTFTWDNVGFDGPLVARDITFDEPDALTAPPAGDRRNLGYLVQPNTRRTLNLPPLHSVGDATAAYLLVNWFTEAPPTSMTYTVNGTEHTVAYPFPPDGWTPRTYAFPLPLEELRDGQNTITFGANGALIMSNGGVVLANVRQEGGPPVVPAATPQTFAIPAPALPTPAPIPPAAPAAQATCIVRVSTDGTTFRDTTVTDPALIAQLCRAP